MYIYNYPRQNSNYENATPYRLPTAIKNIIFIFNNNRIYNNGHYGLDPHTRTHDMLIRNNTVHDNCSIGIVCSLDCSHITIENNKAYSNARIGIMLSRNMHDSIVQITSYTMKLREYLSPNLTTTKFTIIPFQKLEMEFILRICHLEILCTTI